MTKAAIRARRHARGLCLEGDHPTEPGYARCASCRQLRRQQHHDVMCQQHRIESAWQRKLAACRTWPERITAALETEEAGPAHALHYRRIAELLDANPKKIGSECRRLVLLWRLDRVEMGVYALHREGAI